MIRITTVFFAMIVLMLACTRRTAVTESPPTVDTPYVTYSDIQPILLRSCEPCHFPEREGKVLPLDTYRSVKNHLAEMIKRVELPVDADGYMPFKSKRQALSPGEIDSLRYWARSGYPESSS